MNNVPDPAQRIAELEAELAYVKRQRDMYKSTVSSLSQRVHDPDFDRPITPEELEDMLHGPRGASIDEIIAEFDAKRAGR